MSKQALICQGLAAASGFLGGPLEQERSGDL
jgi:hypothetical protein